MHSYSYNSEPRTGAAPDADWVVLRALLQAVCLLFWLVFVLSCRVLFHSKIDIFQVRVGPNDTYSTSVIDEI